jgi:hypothetical protein
MKLKINKPSLHSEIIALVKEQIENAISNIEEDVPECADISNAEMTLGKSDGNLSMVVTMYDDNGDTAIVCKFEIDEFLDTVKDDYSYGEDGWGEEMIDNLEILKAKIQERIDSMRKEMDTEE